MKAWQAARMPPATTTMEISIPLYNRILKVVSFFSKRLHLDTYKANTGRPLALPIEEVISLAIFKKKNNIATTKSLHNIFNLKKTCSYKTLVASLIRWARLGALILFLLMKVNRRNAHPVKHIDATEIPVCLFKNANIHQTMKDFASFMRGAKGTYFGLKLHMCSDLKRRILSIRFTTANKDEREMVIDLCEDLDGIFLADAGLISKTLEREFYQENKRILLIKPRKNMRKLMTEFQNILYNTRMQIEFNFRDLKLFYGLITSLPRSVDGYLTNYIWSLLAYQIV